MAFPSISSGRAREFRYAFLLWTRLVLGLALMAAAVSQVAAQSILIDFGAGNNQTEIDEHGRYWNNLTDGNGGQSDTGELTDLVSVEGEFTAVGLAMIRRFTGANTNGTLNNFEYPQSSTADSLYGNTEEWNGLTDIFPSFKLTGLDPQRVYRLTFYASRMGVGDNRETGYTVTGVNTAVAALDAANNEELTAVAPAIVPTAAGEITISLAPTENNNNGNHFTYLGALTIEEDDTPLPEPIVIVREPDDQTVVQARPAAFSVQIQGSPPYTVRWRRNGDLIAGADQLVYAIPSADLDLNGAVYSVVISNPTSSATSRDAVLTVTPDTQAPALVATAMQDATTFLLAFDEVLDAAQAGDPAGYTASTQDGPLAVVEAELFEEGRSVRLTLDQPPSGTLTIGFVGLRDLVGNLVPPDTTAVIEVPAPDPQTFFFDFGGGGDTTIPGVAPDDDPVNVWNNITAVTEGAGASALVTADGAPTDASLVIVSRFGGVNGDGTREASAPFPVKATRDSFYANTAEFSGLSDLTPIFTLTGLDPAMVYDFTFFASRMNAGGDNRETRYTVTGATTGFAELNVAENVSGTATVAGIRPADTEFGGEITIELTPTENNTNGFHFVYLGVMKVTFRDPSVTPIPVVMSTPTIQDGKVILDWTGTGALQRSESLRENEWTPVTPAPTPPYAEDLVPGGSRFYRVVSP